MSYEAIHPRFRGHERTSTRQIFDLGAARQPLCGLIPRSTSSSSGLRHDPIVVTLRGKAGVLRLRSESTYSILGATEAELARPRWVCKADRTIIQPLQHFRATEVSFAGRLFFLFRETPQLNANTSNSLKTLNLVAVRPKVIAPAGRCLYQPPFSLWRNWSRSRLLPAKLRSVILGKLLE
jgi:hypothetical protein